MWLDRIPMTFQIHERLGIASSAERVSVRNTTNTVTLSGIYCGFGGLQPRATGMTPEFCAALYAAFGTTSEQDDV
jgi:hypothetical protein